MGFINYVIREYPTIVALLLEHIQLTVLAVGVAIVVGIPLGILVYSTQRVDKLILGSVNLVQAIPSMALLGAAIPLLGIGKLPAVVVVALYSLLPIVKNTFTGIRSTPREILEAAKGIGLTDMQTLFKVQMPIALPVIMAGVRISAVTAVGLITIAAFIGAGGLGFLVFSGISTVNSDLILAGAIPACLLALAVDGLGALVEKKIGAATSGGRGRAGRQNSGLTAGRLALAAIAVLCVGGFLWKGLDGSGKPGITIGSKDFTESAILAHMYADLIEANTDIKVSRKTNLGGTKVCLGALRTGDIDMYVEYSGTAYGDVLGLPPNTDMDEVYEVVKKEFADKLGIRVLKQAGFNNTYALATTQEIAERYGLERVSDLKGAAGDLAAAMTFEFLNRQDGMPGLARHYGGILFKETNAMSAAQRYLALQNGDAHVIDAYSTDGLLKKFKLITLEDDGRFFPPYYAMPVMNAASAERLEDVIPLIESLGDRLTDEVMIELNYRVDEERENPARVAADFLREQGLVR